MRLTSLLLPLLPVLASSITAYPTPEPCTGACNIHDPALILRPSDNTYFRFSTGPSIQIATACSLAGPWTIAGSALPQNGSSIDLPGNTDAWAPDVSLVDGMYYLYYSVSTFGSQRSAIGVATSKTLDVGGWMDHGSVGVRSDGSVTWNAIDANLVRLHDRSGRYQLVFGSFYGGIHVVNMSDPLVAGSDGVEMTQLVYDPEGSHAVEGGFMYSRGGYYYLFYSWGRCCGYDISPSVPGQEYKIKVCRSTYSTKGFVSCCPWIEVGHRNWVD